MAARKGHRSWGYVVQLPNKSKRFEASYIGPDKKRHYAPQTFTVKTTAEGWLANERAFLERTIMTGETWTSPKQRAATQQAQSITLEDFAKTWIEQRNIKPRTRLEYESLSEHEILPELGPIALRSLTSEVIRGWHAGLPADTPRRNSAAYGLLHAILKTALEDELIDRNPCQIKRAMSSNRKREPVILEVSEIAALADAIGERWRALVLLSAWCGLRWGEVAELRRSDFGPGCETVTVSRAVNHRSGTCTIDTTKSDKARLVVIPPHIRADIKAHLDTHTKAGADAPLFVPVRGGCHLDNKTFADSYLKPALKSIGRESATHHHLRHFAGTMTARVGGSISETMARLGHSTSRASLMYQAAVSERQAVIAQALSTLATTTKPVADAVADAIETEPQT
ncbi:tyrosine-type recombinase/integrase [Mycolicibacterium elephantis]|uniref:Integrase n=3 Tax=Mycobacteriaceae TaxID=1762 RepID=A0A1A3C678_MYCAS|nr:MULTISPECIES: site-specific integrase [Mycobacteriaceae]OBI81842.1 integrase [Mycobacterium asiaticum]